MLADLLGLFGGSTLNTHRREHTEHTFLTPRPHAALGTMRSLPNKGYEIVGTNQCLDRCLDGEQPDDAQTGCVRQNILNLHQNIIFGVLIPNIQHVKNLYVKLNQVMEYGLLKEVIMDY